jgi:peptidoglycan/LPS O-acetylase OafA/YrhL
MSYVKTAADSHEIRALTGIRGFAAGLVLCFHFQGTAVLLPFLTSSALFTSGEGALGVDLFFILSGFILSYVYHANAVKLDLREYGRFLWFRLARIYPNHIATLLALGILLCIGKLSGIQLTGSYPLSDLPAQLTLTHAWPFVHHDVIAGAWNFPSWTISSEWFAYLFIFPITAFILRFRMGPILSLVAAYSALALWLFFPWGRFSCLSSGFNLIQVSCEFFAGCMLFRLYLQEGCFTRSCQKYLSFIFAFLLALLWFAGLFGSARTAAIVLLFPLVLIGLTSEISLVSRLLSTPLAFWLGKVSYAIYMSHALALKIIKVLLPVEPYAHSPLVIRLLILAGHISIILIFAVALYYIVELPSRNYLRRHRPKWMDRHAS